MKKPLFKGFDKVKQAFKFMVTDGNRTDAIRAIYAPSSVGVDILLQ